MNKLWCFGDSFTAGYGLNFDEFNRETSINCFYPNLDFRDTSSVWTRDIHFKKYKEYKQLYKDSIFVKHFSNYLNYDFINEGESGCNNDRIIHQIIKNINQFNSNDVVIIGMTSYVRVLVPSKFGLGVAGKLAGRKKEKHSFVTRGSSWNMKLERAVTDYCHDVLAANESIVAGYYLDLFIKIRESLLPMVKRVILWDHTQWFKYESIKQWKGIDDAHWSPQGHKDFTTFLIENYEKNNDILIKSNTKTLI